MWNVTWGCWIVVMISTVLFTQELTLAGFSFSRLCYHTRSGPPVFPIFDSIWNNLMMGFITKEFSFLFKPDDCLFSLQSHEKELDLYFVALSSKARHSTAILIDSDIVSLFWNWSGCLDCIFYPLLSAYSWSIPKEQNCRLTSPESLPSLSW